MTLQDETGAGWVKARLPWLYTPAVGCWCLVFGSITIVMVVMYVGFVWSGANGLAAALERGEDKSSEYITSLIFLIAGIALLAAFVRGVTARQNFSGVVAEPGQFETLRALMAECAAAAGIKPPEILYLTPDMTVAAYSAGRLSLTREGKRDAVFVGVGALLLLPRSDLKAILLHEFAHLALRRKVLSVDICNKLYNFVPRFASAHRHALAAIVTIIPLFVFSWRWRTFRKAMGPLSRAEELLVDRCAAEVTSPRHYAGALTRFAVLHRAMQTGDPEMPALLTQINADFYESLLGGGDEEALNWFATARRTLFQRREILWIRIEAAKDWYLGRPEKQSGTHPSLKRRAKKLAQDLKALMNTLGLWEHAQSFERHFEEELTGEFVATLRPRFYAAAKEVGGGPLEWPGAGKELEFICQRKGCPRSGRDELSLSDSELRLYGKHAPTVIKWVEIADAKLITKTEGFLTEMAVNMAAEVRGLPSNRTLVIEPRRGRKIVVPHWHCGGNAFEIEGWIEHHIRLTEAAGYSVGKASGTITGRGISMALVVVLLVIVPLIFVSMSVSSKFGYKYGSAVQTVCIIVLICWFMGRRR